MRKLNFSFLVIILFSLQTVSKAQTSYTAVLDGLWDNPDTWSPSGVPGAGDNVSIEQKTVSTNGTREVADLSIRIGGELELTGTNGALTITGNASWGGGIFRDLSTNNNGIVTIANGAVIEIDDTQWTAGLYGGARLLNLGTVRMVVNSGIWGKDSSVIENQGLFEIDTENGNFGGFPNGGIFINTGTIRKSSGQNACDFDSNWEFRNLGGIIDVQSGSLSFNCDGIFNGGSYNAEDGTTLLFDSQNHTFEGTLAGAPAGTIELSAGVTANTGTSGVTLDFQGTGFAWSGGTFDSSMITIPNTGLLVLNGNAFAGGLHGGSKLLNLGTIRQDENNGISGRDSSVIDNQSLYEVVADNASFGGIPNGGIFKNAGTFRNMGSGTCGFNSNWSFQNLAGGIIDAANGVLDIAVFENAQDAIIQGSASINVPVAFTNNGINSPGNSAGKLTYIRDYNPSVTGFLDIELGGLTPVSDYDQLSITGDANLNGTLNISLIDGFVPVAGDSFIVLTTTGTVIDSFYSILMPEGLGVDVHYNPKNVTLIVTSVTSIEDNDFEDQTLTIPLDYSLKQNFPNPFNPSTTIRYGLPNKSNVRLTVYDIRGKKAITLVNGTIQQAGFHQISWDGKNQYGNPVGSGTYIYQIKTGSKVFQRRMILVK